MARHGSVQGRVAEEQEETASPEGAESLASGESPQKEPRNPQPEVFTRTFSGFCLCVCAELVKVFIGVTA